MTTRREFVRRGALWVAAAAVVEPVARKLWAFPTNPLGPSRTRECYVVWDYRQLPVWSSEMFMSVHDESVQWVEIADWMRRAESGVRS